MRVAEVRIIPLLGDTPPGGWSAELGSADNVHCLVELITDQGVSGLGSVFTSAGLVEGALAVLRPLLIGASALDPAATSETLHQHTFWQGRGGAVTHAISGIDIALWDAFGRATGQPISRLLGGRHRERIKPYGSLLMAEPAQTAERVTAAMERGFRALKLGWGPFGRRDAATDEAIVRAARDAAGAEVELMVDAGASDAYWPHGYKWALRTAQMLAGYDITWFEEPLRPDDLEGYVTLTRYAPLPIAGGEVLTRRQSFLPWIERRAVDYLQPDVTKVGGLTEEHRIGQYADDHAIMLVPHGWNTAIGLAADLQLVAAAGNARWVEYITPGAYVEDLLAEPLHLDGDGMLSIPDTPGLGLAFDPDGIAKHSGGQRLQVAR